jgi:hypothetical protein
MLITSVAVQDANTGRTSALINKLVELGAAGHFRRLRAAVAYATYSGCRGLGSKLDKRIENWRRLKKYWLVSIDFGRTEVGALDFLQSLPNSEVRIPNAMQLLKYKLMPEQCFHPKTFIFDSGLELAVAPYALFVGSGNLTLSGLHVGVEHGTALLWLPPLRHRETGTLELIQSQLAWWIQAWESASPLTRSLLTRYSRSRPRRPREDSAWAVRHFASPVRREIEADPGVDWAHATYFWIQTRKLYENRGKGVPGNQLDLKRGTRVYFGFAPDSVPQDTVLGTFSLQYQGKRPCDRSLRFGNNSMDKVNLPIPGQDGPKSYDNSVVRFERIAAKKFLVKLGNSKDLRVWRRKSQEQGMLYKLVGGREFGSYNTQ